jgi:hypothetical protein
MGKKEEFLYPRHPYRGDNEPRAVVFNANLQEFAQRINYICNLESGGKLSQDEAYREIKALWKQLKESKKELQIGENTGNRNADGDG